MNRPPLPPEPSPMTDQLTFDFAGATAAVGSAGPAAPAEPGATAAPAGPAGSAGSAAPAPPDGLDSWRAHRLRELFDLCRRTGVPVDHPAEVRLAQGPVLRGTVRVAEELLWNDVPRQRAIFRIGRVTFTLGEIESVIRLDADPDHGA